MQGEIGTASNTIMAQEGAARARRRESIQDWLLEKVSEVVGVEEADIDIRESLATYGLGSVAAVSLTGELAGWLGRELEPTLFWEHPSTDVLVKHLINEMKASRPGTEPDIAGAA